MAKSLSSWKDTWMRCPPYKLKGTEVVAEGWSVAARNTTIYLGGKLSIMCDAGVDCEYKVSHIFGTHGHSDHSQFFWKYCIDNPKTPTIYVPGMQRRMMAKGGKSYMSRKMGETLHDNISSMFEMSTCSRTPRIMTKINIKDVFPGDTFIIKDGKNDIEVRVFWCDHTVPCVGYGFSEIRRKLKPEFEQYIPTKEDSKEVCREKRIKLVEIKKHTDIMVEYNFPLCCYLGDTTHNVFSSDEEQSKYIFEYPHIFVECTFFQMEHIGDAKKDKHMHWSDLKKVVKTHPNNNFILYHFSQRYKQNEIRDFFKHEGFSNIHLWIPIE
jgi:ribonuclease Z